MIKWIVIVRKVIYMEERKKERLENIVNILIVLLLISGFLLWIPAFITQEKLFGLVAMGTISLGLFIWLLDMLYQLITDKLHQNKIRHLGTEIQRTKKEVQSLIKEKRRKR